jgi:hypothetical protein
MAKPNPLTMYDCHKIIRYYNETHTENQINELHKLVELLGRDVSGQSSIMRFSADFEDCDNDERALFLKWLFHEFGNDVNVYIWW